MSRDFFYTLFTNKQLTKSSGYLVTEQLISTKSDCMQKERTSIKQTKISLYLLFSCNMKR